MTRAPTHWSAEARERLSAAKLGHRHSDETRAKISEASLRMWAEMRDFICACQGERSRDHLGRFAREEDE